MCAPWRAHTHSSHTKRTQRQHSTHTHTVYNMCTVARKPYPAPLSLSGLQAQKGRLCVHLYILVCVSVRGRVCLNMFEIVCVDFLE